MVMKNKLFSGLSLIVLASSMLIGCGGGNPTSSSETSATPSEESSAQSQLVSSEEESSQETTSEKDLLPVDDDKVHIIVLAGQSGARGKGDKSELTADQSITNEDVVLYQDGHTMAYIDTEMTDPVEGSLETFCKPGYGDSSSEIGPEVGIAETFRSRYHDEDNYKAVIVKYTVCGTDFPNHWYSNSMVEDSEIGPTLNQDARHLRNFEDKKVGPLTYDLYTLLTNCIEDLHEEGLEAVIDGLAWVHGEMDAQNIDYIANYQESLGYFIQDFRTQFGEAIPVVITGVLTNAAGYRPLLKAAQEEVANTMSGVTLIDSDNLYSNSFEPWHYSAQSNMVLGNEIAAELLAPLDNRNIVSLNLEEETFVVPHGYEVELPKYLPFTYDEDLTGMSKVRYLASYDKDTLGKQNIPYVVENINGVIYEGELEVEVKDVPYVDGRIETALYKEFEQDQDENLKLYYAKDENGVYFAGQITDDHVWSDSEQWRTGDMGQKDRNDDIRIFLTGSDVESRITVCLSAANMYRVYSKGRSMNTSPAVLQVDNLFYRRQLENPDYRVFINGIANDSSIESTGWDFEFFISYSDLDVDDASELMFCVLHSDIQNPNNISGKGTDARTGGNGSETYIVAEVVNTQYKEEAIESYFPLTF